MPFTPVARLAVVTQAIFTSDQTKVLLLHLASSPHALLRAKSAVALIRAFVQINIGFKRDGLAVATAFTQSDIAVFFPSETTAVMTYRVKQTVAEREGGKFSLR